MADFPGKNSYELGESPVLGETAQGPKASLPAMTSSFPAGLSPPITTVSGKETVQSLASCAFGCNTQQLCRPRAGSHWDYSTSSAPRAALSQKGMEDQFQPMCLLV